MAFLCIVCDKPEKDCKCERYCMLCYSDNQVRLCGDGCYYCAECREICGYTTDDDDSPY